MEKMQMVMSRPESGEWLGNADIMTYARDAKGRGGREPSHSSLQARGPWVTAPAALPPQLELTQGTV